MQKISLFLLRVCLGVLFFYAGVSKLFTAGWSAAGYLNAATTFKPLFQWLAGPSNIGWVSFLNEWGLTLIGVSLILGALIRWSSLAAIPLMVLYYLPILNFPHVGANSYIVDDHIIYICVFLVLYAYNAGKFWGLDSRLKMK